MKKLNDIKLLTFLFILSLNVLLGQSPQIGISLNPGLNKNAASDILSNEFEQYYAFAGNFGIFVEYDLGNRSSLLFEGLWLQMETREISNKVLRGGSIIGEIDEFEIIGELSIENKIHASYFGLPVYYRMTFFNKLGIRGGFQTMVFILGTSYTKREGIFNGEVIDEESNNRKLPLARFDIGPKFGLDYQIAKNFRLRLDYYHGLINFLGSNAGSFKRMNRQATIGIQYFFQE